MLGVVCCQSSLKYLLPYSEILTLELQSCSQLSVSSFFCNNWANFVSLCSEIKKSLLLMVECVCFYRTFFSHLFNSLFWFTNILVSSKPAWSGQRYLQLCYMWLSSSSVNVYCISTIKIDIGLETTELT